MSTTHAQQRIRVGVGGWTYEPWRNNFYPAGACRTARSCSYASRQLTAIEVNGTYYSTFKPATFAKWRDETPDGFVFSLKAHRFATTAQAAGDGGRVDHSASSAAASPNSGDKLGPIVWQFMPTKQFDAGGLRGLPGAAAARGAGADAAPRAGCAPPELRAQEYLELLRRYGCTTVYTDSEKFPSIADAQGDLAYMRLMRSARGAARRAIPAGELAPWARGAKEWVAMDDRKEAFVFFINGAKERAPHAAREFLKQLA